MKTGGAVAPLVYMLKEALFVAVTNPIIWPYNTD